MSTEFWNTRFSENDFAYGKEPNKFFESEIKKLTPGKILLPAEGEGRNAVYAARLGWDVTAFDISEEGKKKAEILASEMGVKINYLLGKIGEIELKQKSFDAVGLIFSHQIPEIRKKFHRSLQNLLTPGGKIILESFSKEQLNLPSGGPKQFDLLHSIKDLRDDFNYLSKIEIDRTYTELNEGKYHIGKASVIRMIGTL